MSSDLKRKVNLPNKTTLLIFFVQLYVAALFLPIKISNAAMFILLAFVLLGGYFRQLPKNIKSYPIIASIAGFFFLHVLALLYSDNLLSAGKELERKMPMLLVPIIFLAVGHEIFVSNRRKLMLVFAISTYAACLFLLAVALILYFQSNDTAVFYYIEFGSPLQFNPVYLGVYMLLSFSFLLIEYTPQPGKIMIIAVIFTMTLFFLVLLSSKSALLLFSGVSLYFIFTRIKSLRYKLFIAALMVVLVVGLISASRTTRERIKDLFNSELSGILENDYTLNASTYTGVTQRFSFWKVSMKELIADNLYWFGVGTGDQKQYLNNAYKKYGLLDAGYVNFNLHNAYFEIILELGVFGFAFFAAWLVRVVKTALRSRDELFIVLVVLFVFPAITESTLNVNKGVAFYSFMFCFLLACNSFYSSTQPVQQRL